MKTCAHFSNLPYKIMMSRLPESSQCNFENTFRQFTARFLVDYLV